MKNKLAILAASLSLVAGCSFTSDVAPYDASAPKEVTTYNVAAYEVSAQNVETLKSYNLRPVSVGTFQASEELEVKRQPGNLKRAATAYRRCLGPILHLTASPSFEGYIEQAFIEELKRAGIYDASSHLVLTGKLEQIGSSHTQPNLIGGLITSAAIMLTPRSWTLTLTLTNARNESFTTQSEFSVPSQREDICGRLALIFAPAVQKLITDVIKNPKFREIAN